MKIGALTRATGTSIATIRYYEHEGLLPTPARSDGNYRIYDETLAERLVFIRHCRELDMTLEEIRLLLTFKDAPREDCGRVNALLDDHIGHVTERIRELKQLARQLRRLRVLCRKTQEAARCGILRRLSQPRRRATRGRGKSSGHVHGAHQGGSGRG